MLCKVDIITTYHVLNRWEYQIKAYTRHKLQHEYISTSIHSNHQTEEQDLTTDEIKLKRRTTSTLLIPSCQPGTHPMIDEEEEAEEELQKQTCITLTPKHRFTCTCTCCYSKERKWRNITPVLQKLGRHEWNKTPGKRPSLPHTTKYIDALIKQEILWYPMLSMSQHGTTCNCTCN
jgi:hypothetical protein